MFFQEQYKRISKEINSKNFKEITYIFDKALLNVFKEKSLEKIKTYIIEQIDKYIKLYNKLNN